MLLFGYYQSQYIVKSSSAMRGIVFLLITLKGISVSWPIQSAALCRSLGFKVLNCHCLPTSVTTEVDSAGSLLAFPRWKLTSSNGMCKPRPCAFTYASLSVQSSKNLSFSKGSGSCSSSVYSADEKYLSAISRQSISLLEFSTSIPTLHSKDRAAATRPSV